MAFFSSDRRATPLVDSEMSEAMRRRLGELIGLGLGALAVLLGLCLASYDINDPSHFSSTGAPPSNLLGRFGAIVADPMMRAFGAASWGLVAFFGVWAARFMFHLGERRLTRRSMIAPLAFVIGTVFASTHVPWPSWQLSSGLGGFVGDTVVRSLIGILPMNPTAALQSLSLAFGAALLAGAGAALGVTAREAWLIVRWMARSLLLVTRQCLRGFGGSLRAVAARVRAWRTRPRSERMPPAEPTGGMRKRMLQARRRSGEPPMSRAAVDRDDDDGDAGTADGRDQQ
ncbi:MAG: DNA translocase FtsK 4TM domain-containing protein, partial [Proteobacteria bacterium]|nr:DNA translocase FtsK 4TM domain-containing protein [Pseudomonadota bacterium]